MRVIMMGTGPFAVPTFQFLADSGHAVLALVTRPIPPVKTRGKQPPNPMRELASALEIPILAPPDVNTEAERKTLADLESDLLVVCDYGQILAAETLGVAPMGGINLHGSLLPKYRGAAPVQWAVLDGQVETGVTVIHMTPRLDAGPSLVQMSTPIAADESAEELEPRLATLGVDAVRRALELLAAWDRKSVMGTVQDNQLSTRAPRLKKSDGQVVWSRPANEIRNQVRGLKPWPGTYTHWIRENQPPLRLILDDVRPLGQSTATPGKVVDRQHDQLVIATGAGALQILRVQPAGKRLMEISEFLRGHDVPLGAQFGP